MVADETPLGTNATQQEAAQVAASTDKLIYDIHFSSPACSFNLTRIKVSLNDLDDLDKIIIDTAYCCFCFDLTGHIFLTLALKMMAWPVFYMH